MNEAEYAKELIRLMEEGIICDACPMGSVVTEDDSGNCCDCHSFIGSTFDDLYRFCPCDKFGKAKALELTWIALEAKGYLEEV